MSLRLLILGVLASAAIGRLGHEAEELAEASTVLRTGTLRSWGAKDVKVDEAVTYAAVTADLSLACEKTRMALFRQIPDTAEPSVVLGGPVYSECSKALGLRMQEADSYTIIVDCTKMVSALVEEMKRRPDDATLDPDGSICLSVVAKVFRPLQQQEAAAPQLLIHTGEETKEARPGGLVRSSLKDSLALLGSITSSSGWASACGAFIQALEGHEDEDEATGSCAARFKVIAIQGGAMATALSPESLVDGTWARDACSDLAKSFSEKRWPVEGFCQNYARDFGPVSPVPAATPAVRPSASSGTTQLAQASPSPSALAAESMMQTGTWSREAGELGDLGAVDDDLGEFWKQVLKE